MDTTSLPIGLFDSGVGGLTVLKALRRRMPSEDLIYLGDTARLPYGTKGPDTITRYALQASARLVERGIKALVIACNTATSVALDALRAEYPDIPVIGVVEPGARAGVAASTNGSIAVVATERTIRGGAYQQAITRLRPDATVTGVPCSLFVALAEEGWTDGPLVEGIAARYLDPVFAPDPDGLPTPDCLVLGCTHFPVLAPAIANVVGPGVAIVDSAKTTADAVAEELDRLGVARTSDTGGSTFLSTDDVKRFARTGSLFLGRELRPDDVELVDL
ncbi:glutamate racemase [Desulfobaculum xiamenense]|uniref:Glutamate racemase n=1 Tax=Desulfobaculum xiamenense TaxID=995050 RepID=A0A846QMK0_9BACT|nr:glutamate racemase [Desulfobaculum xiamenense]NJB66655.1 glutamate racemase [Desulfobaculum xiamenense]